MKIWQKLYDFDISRHETNSCSTLPLFHSPSFSSNGPPSKTSGKIREQLQWWPSASFYSGHEEDDASAPSRYLPAGGAILWPGPRVPTLSRGHTPGPESDATGVSASSGLAERTLLWRHRWIRRQEGTGGSSGCHWLRRRSTRKETQRHPHIPGVTMIPSKHVEGCLFEMVQCYWNIHLVLLWYQVARAGRIPAGLRIDPIYEVAQS